MSSKTYLESTPSFNSQSSLLDKYTEGFYDNPAIALKQSCEECQMGAAAITLFALGMLIFVAIVIASNHVDLNNPAAQAGITSWTVIAGIAGITTLVASYLKKDLYTSVPQEDPDKDHASIEFQTFVNQDLSFNDTPSN